jgi:dTDP-4-dehydrorhamnose reductase
MNKKWADNVSDNPRALIVGASGFLGANVLLALQDKFQCVAHSSSKRIEGANFSGYALDLRKPKSALSMVRKIKPALVINCAALTQIELCESNFELANRLNSLVPAELAAGCAEVGAKFVHVSTDAVFRSSDRPIEPETEVNPINNYGKTKAAGEELVLSNLPSSTIVRTNIVGWSPTGTRSLHEFFFNRLQSNQSVKGFQDSYFRPITANNFWPIVNHWVPESSGGIFHAFGSELISKFEFGCRVAQVFNLDPDLVIRSKMEDEHTQSLRSHSLNLAPSKIINNSLLDINLSLTELRNLAESGYRERLHQLLFSRN